MFTIVIGLMILIYNPAGNRYQEKDSSSAKTTNTVEVESKSLQLMGMDTKPIPSATPSPTPSPTPTPLPVYPLEEDGFPAEITDLVKVYYKAKSNCDIDTMKSISSNPENVITKENLLKLVEGIEDYRNIKCYVKKSYKEGEYIVFVYYDIKFIGLKTLAPSLSKLYLVTDTEGNLKNFDGEISEELRAYIAARSQDEDVIALKDYTNQLAQEAKDKDKELKAFWEILDKY